MYKDLYLQQKGITPKPTLGQISGLECLLKEYIGDEINLMGISKSQYNYLYAMFFKKDYEAIKNFKK